MNKPECACFKGDMRGEDNAVFAAAGVEDVFSQAMTAYNMCPQSGYYVALTSMVLILRKVALVDYRARTGDMRKVSELSELDKEEFDRVERDGFTAMMKTISGDLIAREEELQTMSLEAEAQGSTKQ